MKRQIVKPAILEELKSKKLAEAVAGPATPPSPARSPNQQPRRYQPSPAVRDYHKKAAKVATNIERIQNIYSQNLDSASKVPLALKKKHSLIRDASKERIDIYNSYSLVGNISNAGSGYKSGGASRSPDLSDIRLPKLPALRGQHIEQVERSPSTKALHSYKSRIGSISKLHPIDAVKDVYGSSKISLAPSISSGIRPLDSKLLIDKKNLVRVKPMSLQYRNPLPSLKPISVSPEPRSGGGGSGFQKRTASIDEGASYK